MKAAGLIAVSVVAVSLKKKTGVAQGEKFQEGNIVVSFRGGISPRALPRSGVAPVAVNVDSTFTTSDGADPPPQLQTISIGINRGGKIFDRGLPTCRVHRIQPATIAAVRQLCGEAIVGSGHVSVRVDFENQAPFTFKGPLLVFNAKRVDGERRLIAQVYGLKPPSAFVLTFRLLKERGGPFGTVIKTTLPESAQKWAYVTHFDMRLQRLYTYRGKEHSYVSAGCAAPAGFTVGIFSFAQATFGFADGRQITGTLVRNCNVL